MGDDGSIKDGYSLGYSSKTYVGMSGGGVYTDYQQTKKKGAGEFFCVQSFSP